jgi:hypothetical protein
MKDEIDTRILQLLQRGYSYASCFDAHSRNEVILTSPGKIEFRASAYSEEEALEKVLVMIKNREVSW